MTEFTKLRKKTQLISTCTPHVHICSVYGKNWTPPPIQGRNCKNWLNLPGLHVHFKNYLCILIAINFSIFYPYWFGSDKKSGCHWRKFCGKFYFYFIFSNFKSSIWVSRFEINWSTRKIRSPLASGRVLTCTLYICRCWRNRNKLD